MKVVPTDAPGTTTYEFDSQEERDAWLEREHPERKFSSAGVPGLFNLPGGDQLGVFVNTVTHYPAPDSFAQELADHTGSFGSAD